MASLYAKARGDAEGTVGVVAADVAVGVHNREDKGVVAIRRAEPPTSGAARARVPVLDLAVAGGVIGVLLLPACLVAVGDGARAENFVLGEKENVISRCRYGTRRCRGVAGVVRVLCDALENDKKIRGDHRNELPGRTVLARAEDVVSHIRVFPAARVSIARIHAERRRAARAVIAAVREADVSTAGEGGLRELEVYTVLTLKLGVVVKTDDKGVCVVVGECERAHRAIEHNLFAVADFEHGCGFAGRRYFGNFFPGIIVQGFLLWLQEAIIMKYHVCASCIEIFTVMFALGTLSHTKVRLLAA